MATQKLWARSRGGRILNAATGWHFDSGTLWELNALTMPTPDKGTVLRTIFDVQMDWTVPAITTTAEGVEDLACMFPMAYSTVQFANDLVVPQPDVSFDNTDVITGTAFLTPGAWGKTPDLNRYGFTYRMPMTVDSKAQRKHQVPGETLQARLYLKLGLPSTIWDERPAISAICSITSYMRVLFDMET